MVNPPQVDRPTADDLSRVFELIIRSDVAEYGEPDSELSDLKYQWAQLDLGLDAWLVRGDQGRVNGYAAVVPSRGEVRIDLVVDPEGGSRAIASELLLRAEQRIRELAVGAGPINTHTFLAHVNQQDRELFEGAGYTFAKSFYQMHIDLTDALEKPRWPDGVHVRTALAGEDDEAVFRAVQLAFERTDEEMPYAQWREHMIRPDIYDPELWFLAIAGDGIVGTCLGVKYETEGWIRQFGVIPPWREKGIASAMLRHAFIRFRDRGYQRVGLGMEAANESALHLYRRVGMKVLRQYDEYRKLYNDETGEV